METAALFSEVAEGPENGEAWWLTAEDGVRLRVAVWEKEAKKGTVLLFPGRTEYIEKYGRTARDLAHCGYATFAIDWRGQGLADRLIDDPMSGHVLRFMDYQRDAAAMIAAAEQLQLPKPWHLLAHSMGGCIGLRAVIEGLPVASCAFSGPMWGIHMSRALRPLAWALSWGGSQFGMGHVYAPGMGAEAYVLTEPFETNKLTTDREMYQYMIDQANAQPGFQLGGPSLRWLNEALREARVLSRQPSPDLPCVTFMGSDEEIVEASRIQQRMARWPGGKLEIIEGGRHEVLMEAPQMRASVVSQCCQLFDASLVSTTKATRDRAQPFAAGFQAPKSATP